ncbi:MAG: hypothetical protein ACOVQZ_02940, partial [Candidatus Nanopelagicaceae bacterium]
SDGDVHAHPLVAVVKFIPPPKGYRPWRLDAASGHRQAVKYPRHTQTRLCTSAYRFNQRFDLHDPITDLSVDSA